MNDDRVRDALVWLAYALDDLAADDPSEALGLLRSVFVAPDELRPRIEQEQITEKAARHFAEIAQSLRSRGHDPELVAHFLDRILFCLFAEDAGLLPKGIFSRLSQASRGRSEVFTNALAELFSKMGAHYTDRESIWGLVEPVILRPLRREYADGRPSGADAVRSGTVSAPGRRPSTLRPIWCGLGH